jgi:hypothetical protein
MRGKPTENKPEILERIIDGLWEGETLTSLCAAEGISDRALRDWRKADKELNKRVNDGRLEGIVAKVDIAEDALKKAMASDERNEILGADKFAAHTRWQAEKLLPRFQPTSKSQVEHTGPIVVGWDESPKVAEDKKPDALSELTTPAAAGGEVRKH